MRRAIAAFLISGLMVGLAAPAVEAHHHGTAANVALGLASFAVFNQLVGAFAYPRPVYAVPVYAVPVYVAPPPQVIYAPPPAPIPNAVYYPHGRYELRADGTHYYWVWIPNPPPPPAPGYDRPSAPPSPPAAAPSPGASCKLTGRYVKTPQGTLPECE